MTVFYEGKVIDSSLLKEETKTNLDILHPREVLYSLVQLDKDKTFPTPYTPSVWTHSSQQTHLEELSTTSSEGVAGSVALS